MTQQALPPQREAAEPVREARARQVAPLVDIYENEQELLVVADLPGVERDALRISLDPPELRILARSTGIDGQAVEYARVFRVDERIDPDGISAALSAGVLRIRLKKTAALRPRRIEISSS